MIDLKSRNAQRRRIKLIAAAFAVVIIALSYWYLKEAGLISYLTDGEKLRHVVEVSGAWGPLLIIGLMTLAIIMSPIPSAPIALAAGAAYGHVYGTLYVLVGAELGAICAFFIARSLGVETIQKWLGTKISTSFLGSQNALTFVVFGSRLLPFVSFDIISYAAGLSVISFWRFALATLAGIVPASFLLAHFGSELVSDESDRIAWSVLLLGLLTLIPVAYKMVLKKT